MSADDNKSMKNYPACEDLELIETCSFKLASERIMLCFHVLPAGVKSGNFGHQVNSDLHLQTVEIQMRWLLMSSLIRIFTFHCLLS